MSEKNYVVNVKNQKGTIITFRGDTAQELNTAISDFIDIGLEFAIANVESVLLGMAAPAQQDPVAVVAQAFNATVVSETPTQGFAPVPPPVATPTAAGTRVCNHGPMTVRKGMGAKGEWKGYFCPTPKGTAGQCDPQWLTKKDPEWASV